MVFNSGKQLQMTCSCSLGKLSRGRGQHRLRWSQAVERAVLPDPDELRVCPGTAVKGQRIEMRIDAGGH